MVISSYLLPFLMTKCWKFCIRKWKGPSVISQSGLDFLITGELIWRDHLYPIRSWPPVQALFQVCEDYFLLPSLPGHSPAGSATEGSQCFQDPTSPGTPELFLLVSHSVVLPTPLAIFYTNSHHNHNPSLQSHQSVVVASTCSLLCAWGLLWKCSGPPSSFSSEPACFPLGQGAG